MRFGSHGPSEYQNALTEKVRKEPPQIKCLACYRFCRRFFRSWDKPTPVNSLEAKCKLRKKWNVSHLKIKRFRDYRISIISLHCHHATTTFLLFSLFHHNISVFPPPPLPPPHFYCFPSSTTTTTFPLFSLFHHHHASIVLPPPSPPPPPKFCCLPPPPTFLLVFLFHHHHIFIRLKIQRRDRDKNVWE